MSIQRSSLKTGPAIATWGARKIYFKGGLTIQETKETYDVETDAFGPVDARLQNLSATISGTPVGEWADLAVLYPYLGAAVGSRIHGDTDTPIVITTLDGATRTYHNAAIAQMPSLKLAARATLLGDVRWVARTKDNTAPSAADSLYTIGSGSAPTHTLDPATIYTQPYAGRWLDALAGTVAAATNATPIIVTDVNHGLATGDQVTISGVGGNTAANGTWTITKVGNDTFSLDTSVGSGAYTSGGIWTRTNAWDDFVTAEGFEIAFGLNLADITADGYGTLDQMITSVTAEAKFKPLVSESEVRTKLGLQGAASALQGASLLDSGVDLIIAGTGVHVTLYGAAATSAGTLFNSTDLRVGEVVAVATRTLDTGALTPVARIADAAP